MDKDLLQIIIDTVKYDLTIHCDKKIDAWFAAQEKKSDRQRRAIEKHNKLVEKFLDIMVKALGRRG